MDYLEKITELLRYYILISTTEAGSGHPSSSLSAVELMATLMFGGFFQTDLDNPEKPNNDRLIFSKGHASPLLYALYAVAGKISESELKRLRKIDSNLEGHPTMNFTYTEAPTGSLGQGLSIAVGMAMNGKYLDKLDYNTYVLLGDSEMAEGSNWEAIQLASFYGLDNLIAIVDVNRLGQRGQTMYGHDIEIYQERFSAFGWETILINDGHDIETVKRAYENVLVKNGLPKVIIAKTIKGKGVPFIEDQEGWHGKALNPEQFEEAIKLLGVVDREIIGTIQKPKIKYDENNAMLATNTIHLNNSMDDLHALNNEPIHYQLGELVSPRQAFGDALQEISGNEKVVVLDPEVGNSTFAESFKNIAPERYFPTYITEQNTVGMAVGLARRGKLPIMASFSAFWTRAFDQIRMAQYARVPMLIAGTHTGISIGEDGGSQMGLEDVSMFRSLRESVVVCPSDGNSTVNLIDKLINTNGIKYIRLLRNSVQNIYSPDEDFEIGKCKLIRASDRDQLTIIASGITVHEAIKAYEILDQENIVVRIIDLYSIKPFDEEKIWESAVFTNRVLVVEDHFKFGGVGEAIGSFLVKKRYGGRFRHLSVEIEPHSGKSEDLLNMAKIDYRGIIHAVKNMVMI